MTSLLRFLLVVVGLREFRFGAAAAFVVVYLLRGFGPDACRYLLASPAVFALITLLSRMGTPESARWPVRC